MFIESNSKKISTAKDTVITSNNDNNKQPDIQEEKLLSFQSSQVHRRSLNQKKQHKNQTKSKHINQSSPFLPLIKESQEQFFNVMDLIDEYDHKIKEINSLHTQGILSIASVKFANPYTSLNVNGFKPTPATRKVKVVDTQANNNNQSSPSETLQLISPHQLIKFSYSPICSKCQDPQTYQDEQYLEEQNQIEKQCQEKITKMSRQQFYLDRFNIDNQRVYALDAQKNFNQLLQKLIQLNILKNKVNKYLGQVAVRCCQKGQKQQLKQASK